MIERESGFDEEGEPQQLIHRLRLTTLDLLKGIGLIFILYSHLSIYMGSENWESFHAFQLIFYRPIGPANYTLCSIFGVMLSLDRKSRMGGANHDQKESMIRIFKRMVALVIFGCLINLGLIWHELINPGTLVIHKILKVLFTWNIITAIGFGQLIAYFFIKLGTRWQIATVTGVFAFYYAMIPAITNTLVTMGLPYQTQDLTTDQGMNAILFVYHYLFFYNSMAPFIPCIGFTLLTCIVFKNLSRMISKGAEIRGELREIPEIRGELRKISYTCLGLLALSLVIGRWLGKGVINQNEYYALVHDDPLRIWNPALGGYPLFLQANNPAYVLFSFSTMALITVCMMWRVDFNNGSHKWINLISTTGRYTLTLFITHGIFALVPITLDLFPFFIVFLVVTAAYIAGFHLWERKGKGKYSLEWFVKLFVDTTLCCSKRVVKKNKGK